MTVLLFYCLPHHILLYEVQCVCTMYLRVQGMYIVLSTFSHEYNVHVPVESVHDMYMYKQWDLQLSRSFNGTA